MRLARPLAAAILVVAALSVPQAAQAAVFKHPGVLVSRAQLDFVRANLGNEPWKSAWNDLQGSPYASLSYTAKPRAEVECGPSVESRQRLLGRAQGRHGGLHARPAVVPHQGLPLRAEGDPDHGRLVGRDHQTHREQRAAADRLGGRQLLPRRRAHQAHLHRLDPGRPVRRQAPHRVPPDPDRRKAQQQRQLGTDHDRCRYRHRRASGRPGVLRPGGHDLARQVARLHLPRDRRRAAQGAAG